HRDLHSFPTRRSSDLGGGDDVLAQPAATSAAVTRIRSGLILEGLFMMVSFYAFMFEGISCGRFLRATAECLRELRAAHGLNARSAIWLLQDWHRPRPVRLAGAHRRSPCGPR